MTVGKIQFWRLLVHLIFMLLFLLVSIKQDWLKMITVGLIHLPIQLVSLAIQ